MDSSSQLEGTTTATTASTTPMADTMTITPRRSRTTRRPVADAQHDSCWCGQDMDVVRGDHCPRCGTMRVRRAHASVPSLARLAA